GADYISAQNPVRIVPSPGGCGGWSGRIYNAPLQGAAYGARTKEKKRTKRPSSHSFAQITSLRPQRLHGHCRCRKPCRLCGADEARRTWGKQRRRGSPASNGSCVSCLFSPWILYTWVLPFGYTSLG